MIEPNRLAHVLRRPTYQEFIDVPDCVICKMLLQRYSQKKECTKATVVAWQNMAMCDHCYERYKEKHKLDDKRSFIRKLGEGVTKLTDKPGDFEHFPEMHDEVTILYELRVEGEKRVIDSNSMSIKSPLKFKAGASGPCLHVQILSAHRLYQSSIFDVPDPFVAVYWGDRLVGATKVKEDTKSPVWTTETFVIPLEIERVASMERAATRGSVRYPLDAGGRSGLPLLRAEVFDYNTIVKDEFIGQAVLSEMQLIRVLAMGDTSEARIFPLQPRLASGTMRVGASRTFARGDPSERLITVKVGRCVEVGGSDPYLVAYFGDDLIGRTPFHRNTLNPTWDDSAVFVLSVVSGRRKLKAGTTLQEVVQLIGSRELRIEVRDHDMRGAHKSLGEVRLSGASIAHLIKVSEAEARKMTNLQRKKLDEVPMTTCVHYGSAPVGTLPINYSTWLRKILKAPLAFYRAHKSKEYLASPAAAEELVTEGEKAQSRLLDLVPTLKPCHFADSLELPLVHSKTPGSTKDEKVKGTLAMRVMYHTRGTVLRGLDQGVMLMSLGERAKLSIRPDYGFDIAKPGPSIPASARLECVVDLIGINKRVVSGVVYRRTVAVFFDHKRAELHEWWLGFEERNPATARFLVALQSGLLKFYKFALFPLGPLYWFLVLLICPLYIWWLRRRVKRLELIRLQRECARTKRHTAIQAVQSVQLNSNPLGLLQDDDDDDEDEAVSSLEGDGDSDDILDVDDPFTQEDAEEEDRQKILNGGAKDLFSGVEGRGALAADLTESLATGLHTMPSADAQEAVARVLEGKPITVADEVLSGDDDEVVKFFVPLNQRKKK